MILKDFKWYGFQSLQTFKVQKILEGYSFLPKEFPGKNGFLKLQQLIQNSLNHYQASLKRPKLKRSKCLTPDFKYHSSTITLNTFRAFQIHPSRGCLSHYFKHDPQCPKVGPSLNPDTRAILIMIFSNCGRYSLYPVQFKISIKRRRNLSS